jgi:hypothetical protein
LLDVERIQARGVELVLPVVEDNPLGVAQDTPQIVKARLEGRAELLDRSIRPQLQPNFFASFAVQVFGAQGLRAGLALGFAGDLQQIYLGQGYFAMSSIMTALIRGMGGAVSCIPSGWMKP